jgi:predicted DNA-binding ribbon-helix-helix protein
MVATRKNKVAEKTTRVSVTFDREDYEQLEQLASRQEVSIAGIVRKAVQEHLDRKNPLFKRSPR